MAGEVQEYKMKGLIIKSPYIDSILEGKKVWELRGSNTKIRGRIALIKSGTKTIVGYADLVSSAGPCSLSLLEMSEQHHLVNPQQAFDMYKKVYAWHLTNVEKLDKPIPYKHPQGAIIWVNLPESKETKELEYFLP